MQVLSVMAVCSCFVTIHSFMVSNRGKMFFQRVLGEAFMKCWYRAVFVILSAVMMSGVYLFLATSHDDVLFVFPSWMKWPMHIVQVGGMFFGMASLLVLNAPEFFGLSQVKRYKPGKFNAKLNVRNPDSFSMNLAMSPAMNPAMNLSGSLSIDGLSPFELVTTGVYSIVRHPIYLAGILMITFQPVVTYNWLTVTVMSDLYFIAAAIKEERALQKLPEVGYREYMDMVPMFNLLAGVYRRCKM